MCSFFPSFHFPGNLSNRLKETRWMTKKKEVRGKSKHLPRPRACSTPIVPGRILDAIAIRTSVTSKEKSAEGGLGIACHRSYRVFPPLLRPHRLVISVYDFSFELFLPLRSTKMSNSAICLIENKE